MCLCVWVCVCVCVSVAAYYNKLPGNWSVEYNQVSHIALWHAMKFQLCTLMIFLVIRYDLIWSKWMLNFFQNHESIYNFTFNFVF